MEFAPANDPFALSVGATDTNGTTDPSDDTLTPWSSYGTTLDGAAKPEIVAPGRLIMSYLAPASVLGTQAPAANWAPRHSYAEISGTSFSAPQVAGAAAVLFQQHPDWTPGQVKWVLASTARPVSGSTAGSLDLAAATQFAGTPLDANAGLQLSQFGLPSWVQGILNGQSFHGNSWNGNSWNGNSWNANSWNGNSWNANKWSGNSWNANSWNDHGWDK
jgi:serine protease AprX